jgi:hypothetical protein
LLDKRWLGDGQLSNGWLGDGRLSDRQLDKRSLANCDRWLNTAGHSGSGQNISWEKEWGSNWKGNEVEYHLQIKVTKIKAK